VSSAQRYLTDEDFDNDVLRGLVRRLPELDVLRVQDVGLAGADDPVILEWAAQQERILLLTHDAKTMPDHAYARLRAGQRVSGVCVISQAVPIGQAIEGLMLIIECSVREDWDNQVRYLPL
jgi:hypothetical protein